MCKSNVVNKRRMDTLRQLVAIALEVPNQDAGPDAEAVFLTDAFAAVLYPGWTPPPMSSSQPTVQPGQIWRRNTDKTFVLVVFVCVGGRAARIRGCTPTGKDRSGARSTEAQVARFDGSSRGYSFHAVAP